MRNFNNPTSHSAGDNSNPLGQLVVKPNPGAIALARAGLGEEVVPGVFVLERRAMLAALALKVYRDQQFINDEASMWEKKKNEDPLSPVDLQSVALTLIKRIESKVNLPRSIVSVPSNLETRTNLLALTIPTLDMFSSYGKEFSRALEYVTQANNLLVPEGSKWSREVLFTCGLQRGLSTNPQTDALLKTMYDDVYLILRAGGDVVENLQSLRLLPLFEKTTTAAEFWGSLFTHKHNCDNPNLLRYTRKFVTWPTEWESVDNDATFVALFVAQVLTEGGQLPAAKKLLSNFSSLQIVASNNAQMVSQAANVAERRLARWN